MVLTEHAFHSMLTTEFSVDCRDDVSLQGDQLFTTDLLIEGTHFNWTCLTPEDLGWKAVAVNASDIAATGGVLDGILVSLGLPHQVAAEGIKAFYRGLSDCLTETGGQLWGGDTARSPQWVVNVVAIGHMTVGYVPGQRFLAQPGDWLLTTGPHGLSAVGFQVLSQSRSGYPLSCQKHRRPFPRLDQGLQLAAHLKRYAMMDTSDGLADAALKLAMASRVGVQLDTVSIHPEVFQWSDTTQQNPLSIALYGGEDYELLAAVPPGTIMTGWYKIGTVTDVRPGEAWYRMPDGSEMTLSMSSTFQHFS